MAGIEELLGEFQEVGREWEAHEDRLLDLLKELIDALEDSSTRLCLVYSALNFAGLTLVPQELQKRVAAQPDCWKGLHAKLSKFGKIVEKKFKSEEISLVQYENDKEEEDTEKAVNTALLQHFYREGNFEIADTLCAELSEKQGLSVPEVEKDMRKPFEEMHELVRSLADHNIVPVVEWAKAHDAGLGEEGRQLQFQLHSLALIEWFRKDRKAALFYAREHLAPFYETHAEDIESLLGALAYSYDMEHSPYSALLYDDLWGEAEDKLVGAYCGLLGMAKESALKLCAYVGMQALPEIARVLTLMKGRTAAIALGPSEELPINTPVPLEHRYHSIFVCPVLKSQSTPNNPPMLLSCGHVISHEAILKLSRGNPNHKIKCPYCPAEFLASTAKRLYL